MKIDSYLHHCTVQTGDMAGSKYMVDVSRWDVEAGVVCRECGEPLATIEQITLHMYDKLTES